MLKQLRSLKKSGGHWQRGGCQGQICQSSHTVLGGQAMFAWHNKTLKPQLKGNIWKEGLYVSHRERRARDTHRERWWINRGEKPTKRSSCLDLTSPDGLRKAAQDGEQCASVCMCTCEREEDRIGRCDIHSAYKESLSPSHLTGWF